MAVSWGILGTARTNRRLLAAAAATDAAEFVAVASREGRRAKAYAAEKGIPRAHASYEALLEDPEVEAVYISLPNSMHLEWSLRALSAGKHVLCEKPLSPDPLAVEEAFDAASRSRRLLTEGLMYRHHPQTRRLEELVQDGAIGRPLALRAVFSFVVDDPANLRLSAPLGGGALMDVGCYCTDICRLVAGEPTGFSAEQIVGPSGVDLRFAGTLRFGEGAVAQFLAALDLPKSMSFQAIGEEGTLALSDPWHCKEPGIERRNGERVERIEVDGGDPYLLELEDACAAIEGAEPLLGRENAVRQAEALQRLAVCVDS